MCCGCSGTICRLLIWRMPRDYKFPNHSAVSAFSASLRETKTLQVSRRGAEKAGTTEKIFLMDSEY
jgi:hypothetical protein